MIGFADRRLPRLATGPLQAFAAVQLQVFRAVRLQVFGAGGGIRTPETCALSAGCLPLHHARK